jgi:hypothetical protein
MKISVLFFIGLTAAILSIFYIITPADFQTFNFNEVFAQSEGKNKNFEDAKTIHSSETNTNLNSTNNNSQKKTLDDTTTNSTETNTNLNSTSNNSQRENLDDVVLSQSNDTSITPDNKNKDKTK